MIKNAQYKNSKTGKVKAEFYGIALKKPPAANGWMEIVSYLRSIFDQPVLPASDVRAGVQGSLSVFARAVYSEGQRMNTSSVEATALTSVVAEPILASAAERSCGMPKI